MCEADPSHEETDLLVCGPKDTPKSAYKLYRKKGRSAFSSLDSEIPSKRKHAYDGQRKHKVVARKKARHYNQFENWSNTSDSRVLKSKSTSVESDKIEEAEFFQTEALQVVSQKITVLQVIKL